MKKILILLWILTMGVQATTTPVSKDSVTGVIVNGDFSTPATNTITIGGLLKTASAGSANLLGNFSGNFTGTLSAQTLTNSGIPTVTAAVMISNLGTGVYTGLTNSVNASNGFPTFNWLTAYYGRLDGNNTFTGVNTFSNAQGTFTGTHSGVGNGLTALTAGNLQGTISGTVLANSGVPTVTNAAFLGAVNHFTSTNSFDILNTSATSSVTLLDSTVTTFGASVTTATNSTDFRSKIGLGNSATLNIGTTAGTVAAGDDSRIVNAVQQNGTITGTLASSNSSRRFLPGTTFCLIGDSIGAGDTPPNTATSSFWSQASRLPVFTGTSFYNFAVDGTPSSTGLTVYTTSCAQYRPTAYGGSAGVPEAYLGIVFGGVDYAAGITPTTYAANLTAIANAAHANGTKVIGMTLMNGKGPTYQSLYNPVIANLQATGVFDYVFDLSKILTNAVIYQSTGPLFVDSAHPNIQGNEVIAEAFAKFMSSGGYGDYDGNQYAALYNNQTFTGMNSYNSVPNSTTSLPLTINNQSQQICWNSDWYGTRLVAGPQVWLWPPIGGGSSLGFYIAATASASAGVNDTAGNYRIKASFLPSGAFELGGNITLFSNGNETNTIGSFLYGTSAGNIFVTTGSLTVAQTISSTSVTSSTLITGTATVSSALNVGTISGRVKIGSNSGIFDPDAYVMEVQSNVSTFSHLMGGTPGPSFVGDLLRFLDSSGYFFINRNFTLSMSSSNSGVLMTLNQANTASPGIFKIIGSDGLGGALFDRLPGSGNLLLGTGDSSGLGNYPSIILAPGMLTTITVSTTSTTISGNVALTTIGNHLQIKTGTNAAFGTVALSSGVASVTTTAKTATNSVLIGVVAVGGTAAQHPYVSAVSGTTFTISGAVTDTSTVSWMIVDPIP